MKKVEHPDVFLEGWPKDHPLPNSFHGYALRLYTAYEAALATRTEARRKAPEEFEAIMEWIECEEFYNLMQAYRHRPAVPQEEVLAAYRAVKAFIAGEILEDRSPNSTRSPQREKQP